MDKSKTLIRAVEKILNEDPRTRRYEYNWLFLSKVLREMGFKIFIEFNKGMPSPETLFRERREIINKRNKYVANFKLEENVTIEQPSKK